MPSNASEQRAAPVLRAPLATTADNALKIVVVGGFGVGKTTLVGSVSEMRPLSTEEVMTQAGEGVDDVSAVRDKRTTTAAFDFGRITIDERRVLYLFGAPGQKRFWFLWNQLFTGSLGAVVLVDTDRVRDSWYAIDRLEHHRTPFVVAVNRFGPGPGPGLAEVRRALDVSDRVPLVDCDARSRESSRDVLVTLVQHVSGPVRGSAAVPASTSVPTSASTPEDTQ
ncbi:MULTISPECIES: GTP-binding protein [Nocardiopsis]|uniref:ATP-binding protein n=1 Tax=Nocardiopsis sinuspersici TaxID=501010 RepID=A0A1V3C2G7_9ACTN|nr:MULTISPECIES: ATP/GTP-binding protein [Nocardiopsis]NYH51110.1 signal recognition particle receptor subunit beta [Nocardiopsis sinuspersici]OOC54883.1 ATP-binding protein [Nocardiopsis sinuspersici]